ncbi:unnamed protein product, partial [Phaeothamnion confervicola]
AQEAEAAAGIAAVLEMVTKPKRDLSGIAASIKRLSERSGLKPAQSPKLLKDWRLVFASSDDGITALGTGLHKLPLTRMEDMFLTFGGGQPLSGKAAIASRAVELVEVLRVLGPFPNVRNTLTGTFVGSGVDRLTLSWAEV